MVLNNCRIINHIHMPLKLVSVPCCVLEFTHAILCMNGGICPQAHPSCCKSAPQEPHGGTLCGRNAWLSSAPLSPIEHSWGVTSLIKISLISFCVFFFFVVYLFVFFLKIYDCATLRQLGMRFRKMNIWSKPCCCNYFVWENWRLGEFWAFLRIKLGKSVFVFWSW